MNRPFRLLASGLAASGVSSAAAAAPPLRLPPVDQCSAEPSFRQFKASLQRAVAKRDTKALRAMMVADVVVNFGGDIGWKAFAEQWELGRPAKSALWAELEKVLALGCARVGDARIMPSLSGQFNIHEEADGFTQMVVVAPGAPLRRARQAGSAAIGRLSWDVVTALDAPDDGEQIKVRTADGRVGWLNRAQLRSPLDYRLSAQQRAGRWMITAFVAGD